MFSRKFDDVKKQKMLESDLYKCKIINDINGLSSQNRNQHKKIFPAIRGGYIAFYYGGGRLFSFNGRFNTHIKYASVYNYNYKSSYVSEDQLNNMKPITNFLEGYEQIKKNCSLYSNVEAEGVSKLYSKYSYLDKTLDIVILDIEIAFSSSDEIHDEEDGKKQNRIDILLYDKRSSTIRFYEAKHYSNPELWKSEGTKPKVIDQIKRYNTKVSELKQEILGAYKDYINIVNDIFTLDIPTPENLDTEVGLLVFGFDQEQRNRLKKLLEKDNSLEDIKYYYAIGNEGELDIKRLWDNQL